MMQRKKQLLAVGVIVVAVALALFVTLSSKPNAAIASSHPLATETGIKILKQGGNAFDAAVAMSAVLGVVEPYSSGIGGGGFWLLHLAEDGVNVMVDGRETAPHAASRNMYLDTNGRVIPGASIDGPLAAGIPGVPAALEHIAEKYGSLPLTTLLQPAIDYARKGFRVDVRYRRLANFRLSALKQSPSAQQIFLRNGDAPDIGESIVQQDLADTLERIARDGAVEFYRGVVAIKMVESVRRAGGIWSADDLAQYRVVERDPVVIDFNDMKIIAASPPSSGGVALAQMLNMLSLVDLKRLDEVKKIHVAAEVMKRAYRDRAEYLGDVDYVDVPVARLTSMEHARKLFENFSMDTATPSNKLVPVPVKVAEGNDTTHFSIIDAEGNRVAATLSINYPFGSGFVAEGTGVLLNDEMDDFSAKPGVPNVYGLVGAEANAIEPGKRMLSSMTPTFLETDERIAVLGTPGGSRIITMVLLSILDFHQGADADQMANNGRFHHQYLPDSIYFEPGVFSDRIIGRLFEMGHNVDELARTYGNMQVVIQDRSTGGFDAASDGRGSGKAVAGN